MSLYLRYNEFYKEYKICDIIPDESIKIGHIQEKILSLCSLMIYNIEYSEFILNDKEKHILGSEKILFSDTFENFLKLNNIELADIKEIIIHDRKRDENGNVIKNNVYIDSYNKWFQLEENENYIKRINSIFRGAQNTNINEPLHNLLSNLLDVRFDDINEFQREQNRNDPPTIEIPELPEISELPSVENRRYDFNPFLSNIFMSNHIPFDYYNSRNRNMSYSPNSEEDEPQSDPPDDLQSDPQSNLHGDPQSDPQSNLHGDPPDDPPDDPQSDPIENYLFDNIETEPGNEDDPQDDPQDDPPIHISTRLNENFINNNRIYVNRFPFYRNNLNLFTEILTYNMLEVPINNIINTPINVGEDVTVALTDTEFDEIESFEFKIDDNNKQNIRNDCLICLTDFCEDDQLKKLKCNHCFHTECIKKWICHQSNKCPICRTEIAKGEPKNI
jgi:hypothetical protein